ncbi:caspase family protein [Streptomyces sp. NBC_00510]
MLTARRFTSRTTASTRERLEAAMSNVRPIGLRETHRGAVRTIQSALADLSDAYLLQAQVDGMFGARTTTAVETFQRDYGLYADGFVGKQTMTQIDTIFSGDVLRTPSGMSLHVGVNKLDPAHYGDAVAVLASCVNDAKAMQRMAENLGYSASVLADEDATVVNVAAAIRAATETLFTGDAFLLSFSGHGSQIPNSGADDEPDGMDETLCLYDRMLVDDELHQLLGEFRAGVRVFLVFDSCHSATAAKAKDQITIGRKAIKDVRIKDLGSSFKQLEVALATVPVTRQELDSDEVPAARSAEPLTDEQLSRVFADELDPDELRLAEPAEPSIQSKDIIQLFADLEADAAQAPGKLLQPWEGPYKGANRAVYDSVRNLVGPKEMTVVEAKVVSFAACLDAQTTLAGSVLSEFTSHLVTVWGDGNYAGDGEQLIARLKQLGSQNGAVPTLMTYGAGGSAIAYERPFAI